MTGTRGLFVGAFALGAAQAQKLMADATYNYQFFILRLQRVTGYPLLEYVAGTTGEEKKNR